MTLQLTNNKTLVNLKVLLLQPVSVMRLSLRHQALLRAAAGVSLQAGAMHQQKRIASQPSGRAALTYCNVPGTEQMQTCWQLLGTAAMLAGASHHSECSIKRNEAHQPVTLQGTSNPHTAAFLLVSPCSRPAPNI